MVKKKLIIFDLDGVLINSKKNMENSWNFIKKEHNLKHSFNEYYKFIGLPFQEILKKLSIKKNRFDIENSYSNASILFFNKFVIYKDVNKIINRLRKNYKLAIFTSKDKKRTNMIIKKKKINISEIVTYDKKKRGKPYPDSIFNIMNSLNIKDKNNVIYIGDTKTDFLTAKNAGVKYINANYGFFSLNHSYVINKFSQLPKKLKEIKF